MLSLIPAETLCYYLTKLGFLKFKEWYKSIQLFEPIYNELDNTLFELLRLIENKSNSELYEMPWYKSYTLGRMIQLNTSSPYKNARLKIRKWKNDTSK